MSKRIVLTSAVKAARGQYELIVLLPAQFLVQGQPILIKHPTTGIFGLFYANEDGFLHEGSPTGPRLPAFGSRGNADRDVLLNPILVNFAAHIRLRRFERQNPRWRASLNPEAQEILNHVEQLHEAVTKKIVPSPKQSSVSVKTPSQAPSRQSPAYGHQPLPLAPGKPAPSEPAQPGSPSPGQGYTQITSWEDALKLIHTGNFLPRLLGPTIF